MNKVFIVDDDYYVRKGLLELIDWIGCDYQICGEADNGEDAIELIKETKPDLVVTDIRMPVLDGLDLIKSIVDLSDFDTNFIIISGYNDFKYAQRALRYGVHDFILKPIDKAEFEVTLKRLSKEINKRKKDDKKREKRIAISTLEQVLVGKVEPSDDIEYMKRLKLSNVSEIRYMIIEVNNLTIDPSEVIEVIQKEIEFITQCDHLLIKKHERSSFGLLISNKQLRLFNNNVGRFSLRFQQELERKLNHKVSIYIGKVVEHSYAIKESYQSTRELLQFKYTASANEPINYEELQAVKINYIKLDQSFFDQLMEYVIEKKTDAIIENIDQMIDEFRTKMFARDAVKTTINRCVHEVIRLIKMREGDEHQLSHLQFMLSWDEKPLTLDQIKAVFSLFVLEGSEYIFKLNQDQGKGSIYRVKEYIEAHYNESLTLRSIADKFYMNPAYLGQLFKKTYGIYFRDYFRQVRINAAKKKLRQTDMRVYEIADDIGFDNADYFITQFRKEVGMTPMNYRNKFYKKQNDDKYLEKNGDDHEAIPY